MAKFEKDPIDKSVKWAKSARNLQRLMVGATALAVPGVLIADYVSTYVTGQPTGLKEMAIDFATANPEKSLAVGAGAVATYGAVGFIKKILMEQAYSEIVYGCSNGWLSILKEEGIPRYPNTWNPWQKP